MTHVSPLIFYNTAFQTNPCVTFVKIQKIILAQDGWLYQACHEFPRVSKGDKPPHVFGVDHNTMFSFTSHGNKFDTSNSKGEDPPTLRLHGQTCH